MEVRLAEGPSGPHEGQLPAKNGNLAEEPPTDDNLDLEDPDDEVGAEVTRRAHVN